MLKMSNFTFFHNVFYAICILKSFNSHISVVVCSFFEFRTVSKWCIREWVNPQGCSNKASIVLIMPLMQKSINSLPNKKILHWSKSKAFADDKINLNEKKKRKKMLLVMGRKHCGKRRKCWFPAFSPFPTMFSNALFPRGVSKSQHYVVNS